MTRAPVLTALVLAVLAPAPGAHASVRYGVEDLHAVLSRWVNDAGLVDYEGLAANAAPLDRFVTLLAAVSPDSHPDLFPAEADRMVYWINAYNALMLDRVVAAWPVASVRDIRPMFGVFRLPVTVGGLTLTLQQIEDDILRARFDEPRIHFAISCASASCPPLLRTPWRAGTLEAQLDAATRAFVSDPRNVRLDGARGVVWVSSIFDWYAADFLRSMDRRGIPHPHGVLDWIVQFLPREQRRRWRLARLRTSTLPYDWSINAVSRTTPGVRVQ